MNRETQMKLDFEHATRNLVSDETMSYLKGKSGNIILFGAGKSGDYFQSLLEKYGIQASCYCDNSLMKQGSVKNGLPVYSYAEAETRYPGATVCITSCYSFEIEKQLGGRGDILSVMNTCNWETSGGWTESDEASFIRKNYEKLDAVYHNILKDDKSRAVMQGILNFRLTRNNAYISDIADSKREYFDDSIIRGKPSINNFIDGGAWTGDTLDAFINWKNGRYVNVYCFEAECETASILKKHIADKGYNNITVFNNALWDRNQKIDFFNSNGSGGGYCLNESGTSATITVNGVAADTMIKDPVDMVKLDIEGAEANALLGMKDIIRKNKPVLAVCIYHKQDDFITLPNLVLGIVPEYSIYFRQYMLTPFSTVMYAIIE